MTKERELPDGHCGFELVPDDVGVLLGDAQTVDRIWWHKREKAVCCWRETWRDTDRCIWHAKRENKPIRELEYARADDSERLDGAYLSGVMADDDFSFKGCSLRYADISYGDFPLAQFNDADLFRATFRCTDLYGAQFDKANLSFADCRNTDFRGTLFRNADLISSYFHESYLADTDLHDADLSSAKFHNAKLGSAKLRSAVLYNVEFYDANLTNAKFHDADLRGTQFHRANLHEVKFNEADLRDVEFKDADLTQADCTDADAIGTDFTDAILHDTLLTRADCRRATFTSALLYETVFADTRINSRTTFHEPETTFYDSITSRPAVVYEENQLTSEDLSGDTHRLEAAEWVYRRLEKLHNENALSEQAREYHISKEEARRAYQDEQRSDAREELYEELGERDLNYVFNALKTVLHREVHFYASTLQWRLTQHGESLARILTHSAALILVCGVVYPFVGGFESSSTGAVYRLQLFSVELSRAAIGDTILTVLQSIYFSVITFTTIGYGDLYPTGAGSKMLVGFESLSGAILIALFVFVLGRRVAR